MFKSRLGDYVEIDTDESGGQAVFYCPPQHMRPAHWPAVERRPLPATGRRNEPVTSAKMKARIQRDIETFDNQIDVYWKRQASLTSDADHSVGALAEFYRLDKDKPKPYVGLQQSSKYRIDNNIRLLVEWSNENGRPSFATITSQALIEFLELYDDRPSQKVQMGNALRHLLQVARRLGWRKDNPMDQVRVSNPPLPERDFWSDDDIELMSEMAKELGHPAVAAAIIFLSATGQRYEDAIKMRHGHEYADGYLWFRQSKRDANINGLVRDQLINLIESVRMPGSDFLFTNPKTGMGYSGDELRYVFNKARAALFNDGDTWLTLQTLRHTCVVRLISQNIHPYVIATMTGHKYKSMDRIMERYGIRTGDAVMTAMKALNRASGGADSDFGEYAPHKANWKPRGSRKRRFQTGLARSAARQFLVRNLGSEEAILMLDSYDEERQQ